MAEPIKFDFITDEDLRRTLEQDHHEMQVCAQHKAWKAVHVLAGSIVEAVLVEYLLSTGASEPDALAMTLDQLITASKKAGAVSAKTAELSSAVKQYRNLIHPGRLKRLTETVDDSGAVVAQALVTMIVREVARAQRARYGLTAEQIVNKFETDSSALGIAGHLLNDASQHELERLLLKILPERYFAVLEDVESSDEGMASSDAVLPGHTQLFRSAFDFAPKPIKEKVLARHVDVIRKEPGPRVQVYEEQFFRGSDLQFVNAKDRKMILDHLLSRLNADPNIALLAAMEGVGAYITAKEIMPFVDPLVKLALYGPGSDLKKAAKQRITTEAARTPSKTDPLIRKRLAAWIQLFDEKAEVPRALVVRELDSAYDFPEF